MYAPHFDNEFLKISVREYLGDYNINKLFGHDEFFNSSHWESIRTFVQSSGNLKIRKLTNVEKVWLITIKEDLDCAD